ncbi:GNAT family N-acetyltransferase [Gangjinia marincola]
MQDVSLQITDNEFHRQFETEIDGEKAKIEYASQERKIFLTKVVMSDELKEKGMMNDFIEQVLAIIEERNVRVVPTSPDIAKFMRSNKLKYKSMLPAGIAL